MNLDVMRRNWNKLLIKQNRNRVGQTVVLMTSAHFIMCTYISKNLRANQVLVLANDIEGFHIM